MKAVILAGGFGTRLRTKISDIPKPMAPINGRPFLEFIFDKLVIPEIDGIIISSCYKAEIISDHFGSVYKGKTISYEVEPEPLGTGGAIAYACRNCKETPCLIMNGDSYLDINYSSLIKWFLSENSFIAMVLRNISDVSRYGSVLTRDGIITDFLEKGKTGPGMINAGIYILTPAIFDNFSLKGRFSIEKDFLQAYCQKLKPKAYISDDYFIDIGIPEDYERANSDFLLSKKY